MRFLVILIVGGIAWFLINGFGELRLALENPSPQALSIDEFNQHPHSDGWFTISGGVVNLLEALFVKGESSSDLSEVYLPVVSPSDTNETSTSLLLKTHDPEIVNTVRMLNDSLGNFTTEESARAFVGRHRDQILLSPSVEGLTEYGMDAMESNMRESARQTSTSLADGFVVLNHHEQPSLLLGLLKLVAGIALPIGLIYYIIRKRRTERELNTPVPSAVDGAGVETDVANSSGSSLLPPT